MYSTNGGPTEPAQNPTLYLLFAGYHGHDRGGSGDLVATSVSQREAQEAFRRVRLQIPNREGWAELAAVSASGKVRRLGWFGRDEAAGPRRPAGPATWAVAEVTGADRPTRRWWRRSPTVAPGKRARRAIVVLPAFRRKERMT